MGMRSLVVSSVTVAMLAATLAPVGAEDIPAQPIPQNPGEYDAVPKFVGAPATARPIRSFDVPEHRFMAANGDSNIHNDAYQTDSYQRAGPLGSDIEVSSTFQGAECASVTFDREGEIVTVCVGGEGPRLYLFDPDTLATKASLSLPPRSGGGTGSSPFNDFAGGGYFYLDGRDRAVIPTNTRQLWLVKQIATPSGLAFEVDKTYNLAPPVLPNEAVVAVMPDFRGRYWFVTTRGLVGTVARRSGAVKSIRLEGEVIANSFALDRGGGVYIVTDHKMYRFDATRRGRPKITWKRKYDRGGRVKPGQVSQGSGTTPTVIGRRHVAITDNADPRMHVIVYRRAPKVRHGKRVVCKEAVFPRRKGNTDQSLISAGRSLIVENNYGYSGPTATQDGKSTTPGITRVDFFRGGCRKLWTSREIAPSVVPKVSLATGLVYTYTKKPRQDGIDAWYLTAIDFRTGRTVFRQLSGTGLGYNNNYAPVSLGPDGSAYVGALGGLVMFRDT